MEQKTERKKRNPIKSDSRISEIDHAFQERLSAAMDKKGLDSSLLAKKLGEGWTKGLIDDYLSGAKAPRFSTVALFANVLDVSCDYLAGFTASSATHFAEARAAEELGLTALRDDSIKNLASLLNLKGHWRRDCKELLSAKARWNVNDPYVGLEDYEEPFVGEYPGLKITSAKLIDCFLCDQIKPLLESLFDSILKYITLCDALEYMKALRSREVEILNEKDNILERHRINFYDMLGKTERSSFDRIENDVSMKAIVHEMTIVEAMIQKGISNLLVSSSKIFTNYRQTKNVYKDAAKVIMQHIQHWILIAERNQAENDSLRTAPRPELEPVDYDDNENRYFNNLPPAEQEIMKKDQEEQLKSEAEYYDKRRQKDEEAEQKAREWNTPELTG